MRRTMIIVVITLLLTAMLPLAALAESIPIYIDGVLLETDVPAAFIDGNTMAPLRAVFEAFGANVEWDDEIKTALGQTSDRIISLSLGSQVAYVNGTAKMLPIAPQVINERVMVPLRFVAESLGALANYDPGAKVITINSNGQTIITTPLVDESHDIFISQDPASINGSPDPASINGISYSELITTDYIISSLGQPVNQYQEDWEVCNEFKMDVYDYGGLKFRFWGDGFERGYGFIQYIFTDSPDYHTGLGIKTGDSVYTMMAAYGNPNHSFDSWNGSTCYCYYYPENSVVQCPVFIPNGERLVIFHTADNRIVSILMETETTDY